jgi:hypothetical protein
MAPQERALLGSARRHRHVLQCTNVQVLGRAAFKKPVEPRIGAFSPGYTSLKVALGYDDVIEWYTDIDVDVVRTPWPLKQNAVTGLRDECPCVLTRNVRAFRVAATLLRDRVYLSLAVMLTFRVLVLGVAIAFLSAALLERWLRARPEPGTPPVLYPRIPFIGHIVGLLRDGADYYKITRYIP